jgi:hypothetical protein
MATQVMNLVRDVFQCFLIPGSQKNTRAFTRQGECNFATDTSTTAGNYCALVLKFHQSLRQDFEDYTITEQGRKDGAVSTDSLGFNSLRNLGVLCVSCGFCFKPAIPPSSRERGGCAES